MSEKQKVFVVQKWKDEQARSDYERGGGTPFSLELVSIHASKEAAQEAVQKLVHPSPIFEDGDENDYFIHCMWLD